MFDIFSFYSDFPQKVISDDSGRRSGDGTKLIEDDDAHEIASEKIKRSKGIRLILS